MALNINAIPYTGGVPYGVEQFYVDVMFIAPHGTDDLEVRLSPYAYNEEGGVENKLPQVDGIHNLRFPATAIIKSDFWADVNAGNVHNEVIRLIEEETPDWAGKIERILPL